MQPIANRRALLRSSSALIALPFLQSYGFRRFAAAASPTAPPKRLVFLGMGFGVTRDSWFPDVTTTGKDYALPEGLKPLARHQQDITIIQNLANQFNNEAHWGSTFWLTGANRYAEPGQSFHNSISADQVAAEVLGKETRFSSIQLGSKGGDKSGHGPGLSLAWNRQGKPMSAINTPVAAFHRLFSDETTPLKERQLALQQQRSILDTVIEDAKSVQQGSEQNRHQQTRRVLSVDPRNRNAACQRRAMARRPQTKTHVGTPRNQARDSKVSKKSN